MVRKSMRVWGLVDGVWHGRRSQLCSRVETLVTHVECRLKQEGGKGSEEGNQAGV
jgi:hypothetical protein